MPVFKKQILSSSDEGLPFGVTATASGNAALLHQVQATATNVFELITLWFNNGSTTAAVEPIIEVTNGSTSLQIQNTIGPQSSARAPIKALNQLPLAGTDSAIHTYATEGVTYFAWGYADRIATG